MKVRKSINDRIKNFFSSRRNSSPNQTKLPLSSSQLQSDTQPQDDGDIEGGEGETGEEEEKSTLSLKELTDEMAIEIVDDEDESEKPSATKEKTDASKKQSTKLTGNSEETDDDTTLDKLLSKKEGMNVSSAKKELSSISTFSLDELAERMGQSHEGETKKESSAMKKESSQKKKRESSKKKEREVSGSQLSEQKEVSSRKSKVNEKTTQDESLGSSNDNYTDLSAEINKAKKRLGQLERWYNIAMTRNLSVRGKFMAKAINNLKSEIDILQKGQNRTKSSARNEVP